ncbi:MAG: hypothetical protein QXJ17_00320 [Nitrososphaeria archaeon]
MGKKSPSVYNDVSEQQRFNLEAAIEGKKYWNISERRSDYVYAIALSRARAKASYGFYARTSFFKRVQVVPQAAKYCRKYRVLLIEVKTLMAYKVITWNAFCKLMRIFDVKMLPLLLERGSPYYINLKVLTRIRGKAQQSKV